LSCEPSVPLIIPGVRFLLVNSCDLVLLLATVALVNAPDLLLLETLSVASYVDERRVRVVLKVLLHWLELRV